MGLRLLFGILLACKLTLVSSCTSGKKNNKWASVNKQQDALHLGTLSPAKHQKNKEGDAADVAEGRCRAAVVLPVVSRTQLGCGRQGNGATLLYTINNKSFALSYINLVSIYGSDPNSDSNCSSTRPGPELTTGQQHKQSFDPTDADRPKILLM